MRKLPRSVLASAFVLALAASGTANAQFSNVFYFGDSLSDAGSYKPVLPPGTGLFTTNPGPIWAQVFGANYGFTVTPANQGGTDYAQGGARVTSLPGVPSSAPTGTAVPIATQISQFLAKGPANPSAFYSVWGGANDIFYQLGLVQAGMATVAQAQAGVGLAALNGLLVFTVAKSLLWVTLAPRAAFGARSSRASRRWPGGSAGVRNFPGRG